jgi:hypothetical protein
MDGNQFIIDGYSLYGGHTPHATRHKMRNTTGFLKKTSGVFEFTAQATSVSGKFLSNYTGFSEA